MVDSGELAFLHWGLNDFSHDGLIAFILPLFRSELRNDNVK